MLMIQEGEIEGVKVYPMIWKYTKQTGRQICCLHNANHFVDCRLLSLTELS